MKSADLIYCILPLGLTGLVTCSAGRNGKPLLLTNNLPPDFLYFNKQSFGTPYLSRSEMVSVMSCQNKTEQVQLAKLTSSTQGKKKCSENTIDFVFYH